MYVISYFQMPILNQLRFRNAFKWYFTSQETYFKSKMLFLLLAYIVYILKEMGEFLGEVCVVYINKCVLACAHTPKCILAFLFLFFFLCFQDLRKWFESFKSECPVKEKFALLFASCYLNSIIHFLNGMMTLQSAIIIFPFSCIRTKCKGNTL